MDQAAEKPFSMNKKIIVQPKHAADRAWDFNNKPLLIFWETTSACNLACRHCRACARPDPLDGELTESESRSLLEQIAAFGKPSPIVVFTGGDPLMRPDIEHLLRYGQELGLRQAVSPAVTPLLDADKLKMISSYASAISLSLDGEESFHDWLRGVPGTWKRTLNIAERAAALGLKVQFNTAVMADNIEELPFILKRALDCKASAWELFFLVGTGRGTALKEAKPRQASSVCRFLRSVSGCIKLRTVEAPFYRVYNMASFSNDTSLVQKLVKQSSKLIGRSIFSKASAYRSQATGDGKGIVFINSRGYVTPSGFLPIKLGSVKEKQLPEIYRDETAFKTLRNPQNLKGRCGQCQFRDICGGSRARAAAHFGDPLEEDPACSRKKSSSDLTFRE